MATEVGDIIGQSGSGDYKLVKGRDVDITNAVDFGLDLVDADLILVDDDSVGPGTQASTKKSALSRVWTYILAKINGTTLSADTTGNAATVTTNANLTGHVTSVGNAAVLGSFTSSQLATALTNETGSGSAVFATSPTFVTPVLGTPASGVATNLTGTAASLTAGNVTTNANLTGHITSTGNAAVLGSFTVAQLSAALSDATISGNNSGDQTVAYTSAISPGNSGLVPAAGTSGHYLAHDGLFAQVAYGQLSGTPTIPSGNAIIDWTGASAGTIHASNYTDTDTVYSHPTGNGNNHIPADGVAGQFLKYTSAGTAVWAADNDTTYSAGNSGLVPAAGTAGHFLKHDGTFGLPSYTTNTDTNTNQLTTFTVSATTDSNATTISQGDDLMIAAGTGITTETTADGTVTITNTVTDTNTMGSGFTVSATTDSNATTITQGDDLMFTAGTGITCETTADGTVTITNTVSDTNTTYTAGDGITLNTAEFDIDAGQTTITSVYNTALKVGTATDQEYITFGTSNEVNTFVNNGEVLSVTASGVDITGDLDVSGIIEPAEGHLYRTPTSTDYQSQGDIVYIGGGTTVRGALHYFRDTGVWAVTDADAVSTSGGVLLAIALGTDPSAGMLLRGMFTLDHDPGTLADALYVSTVAGKITSIAPTASGDTVRIVGYCLDSTNGQIWFNPDHTWVEIA